MFWFNTKSINWKLYDTNTLRNKMNEIMSYYQNKPNELPQLKIKTNNITSNNISSKLFTSKIHKFENLPEPKNATEGIIVSYILLM